MYELAIGKTAKDAHANCSVVHWEKLQLSREKVNKKNFFFKNFLDTKIEYLDLGGWMYSPNAASQLSLLHKSKIQLIFK